MQNRFKIIMCQRKFAEISFQMYLKREIQQLFRLFLFRNKVNRTRPKSLVTKKKVARRPKRNYLESFCVIRPHQLN